MTWPVGLRALEHRDYRIYYAALLVGLTGNWMQTVTQSWLVLQLTESPLLLGLMATMQFAPLLLFAMVGGAIADRVSKRRLLVGTQSVHAGLALTLGLLVWSGHVRYWHVAVVAVLWGLSNALDQPARQSFIVELVGRRDLISAVGLQSAAFNGARIVGPAVAGILIARIGIAPAFVLNAAAVVVSIAALLMVPARGAAPRGRGTMLQEIGEGLAYALGTPRVRLVLGILVITSFCVFNFTVYVPLLARTVLGLGSEGFGFLMTCLGVGAVTAGLMLGALGSRQPPLAVLAGGLGLACAGLIGLAAARHVWLAVPLLAMVGFTGTVAVASCNTALQLLATDALRGRVMSVYTLLSSGIFPVGAFWVGAVSQAHGVAIAFLVNGLLGLVALGALLIWWTSRGATVSEPSR